MDILITGICGFAGSLIARSWAAADPQVRICGIDNLSRSGSETNLSALRRQGIRVFHGDLRCSSDFETLPRVDWVIDAAANPSVLAGVGGDTSSRQLLEHNLFGTVNLLEYCKRHRAGLILISTSRVYSIAPLAGLQMEVRNGAYHPATGSTWPHGVSERGVSEAFATTPPLSLYGSSKLASELLALEYGTAFSFPVFIDRCGVFAGAGQFGRSDQGIFSYWIHAYAARRPLRYIGFDGCGYQVRDCLHPRDLVPLLQSQTARPDETTRIVNLGGGGANALSLAQLSVWCAERFGAHEVVSDRTPRPYDIPWLVMDSSLAAKIWQWQPTTSWPAILEEIALHAEQHPDWLDLTGG